MLVVNPRMYFYYTDANGYTRPAAGYKLWTYVPGTTTPKTTYSDKALTTPHTNPVVLASDGGTVVYASGATKFNLLTDQDVQVTGWPVDSVEGVLGAGDSPSFNDLTLADDLTVGGRIDVTETITSPTITISGILMADDVIIGDDLSVAGSATVQENLTVSGTTKADGVLMANRLYNSFTTVSTSGTGEDILQTYTLPAGTLTTDGMGLKIRAKGTCTNGGAGTVTIKLYVGSVVLTVFGSPQTVADALKWSAEIEIFRTSATTMHWEYIFKREGGASEVQNTDIASGVAITWADEQLIKITGECSNAADTASINLFTVSFIND